MYTQEEKEVLANYKFYLSFENSHCPEYITEKVYRIINSIASENPPVPIVMGAPRTFYKDHLPPNSFIHIDEFNNTKELGQYLLKLNSHDDLYLEYLNWRKNHKPVHGRRLRCKLCNFLLKKKSYNSYHQILSMNRDDLIISDFESFWRKARCLEKNYVQR